MRTISSDLPITLQLQNYAGSSKQHFILSKYTSLGPIPSCYINESFQFYPYYTYAQFQIFTLYLYPQFSILLYLYLVLVLLLLYLNLVLDPYTLIQMPSSSSPPILPMPSSSSLYSYTCSLYVNWSHWQTGWESRIMSLRDL